MSGNVATAKPGSAEQALAPQQLRRKRNTDVEVKLLGGTLTVRYTDDGTVYLTGDAVEVFEGKITIG